MKFNYDMDISDFCNFSNFLSVNIYDSTLSSCFNIVNQNFTIPGIPVNYLIEENKISLKNPDKTHNQTFFIRKIVKNKESQTKDFDESMLDELKEKEFLKLLNTQGKINRMRILSRKIKIYKSKLLALKIKYQIKLKKNFRKKLNKIITFVDGSKHKSNYQTICLRKIISCLKNIDSKNYMNILEYTVDNILKYGRNFLESDCFKELVIQIRNIPKKKSKIHLRSYPNERMRPTLSLTSFQFENMISDNFLDDKDTSGDIQYNENHFDRYILKSFEI